MSTAELDQLASPRLGRRATDDALRLRPRRPPREIAPGGASGADDIAGLFTAVRPCDCRGTVLARRAAPELDARASATAWIVSEGLQPLDQADRQRVLDGWRAHRDVCEGMRITDGGCEVRIGGATVTGTVRAALLEWLPLSPTDLVVAERGLWRDAPAKALTLLVRPPTIWPAHEAVTADRLFPRGPQFEPERFAALERHALGRVGESHLSLLRKAAGRIERQLPAAGLPVASSIVAAGCAVLMADDEWCTALAARQLARYATSEWVVREAREGASR